MPRKIYKPEEIIAKLRQVEVLTSQSKSAVDAIRLASPGTSGAFVYGGAAPSKPVSSASVAADESAVL
jgi:hypothetical protein